ncbi:MAG: Tll0287-like domain-containing protein [Nonlabens sp.]|uniref:Tll0287-like domain-containing protein n=1 Tax=Nonlabens sp. TaxID=1888209 RepID=UPI003EFAFC46
MKHYSSLLLTALMLLLFTSCNDSKKTTYTDNTAVKESLPATNHPGKKLMETQCYVCHNPSTHEKGRIAPPMVAIKSHYMTDDITQQEFADAMWRFVEKPSGNKSKMRGAVNRFGVMPYQPFVEEEIRQIADYIYNYKIDEPDWFKQHVEEESQGKMQYRNEGKVVDKTTAKNNSPVDRGLEYAMSTKKELGKNLMGTIQKKGTKEAVLFCNKQAYPITDSMAIAQNATIKRVSDKPRNQQNQANQKELKIIDQFKKAIASKEDYQPITELVNGKNHFYYPITTNSMCLQCHGTTDKDINPTVLTAISKLYPEDKATGYDVNEVRGIWSITYE